MINQEKVTPVVGWKGFSEVMLTVPKRSGRYRSHQPWFVGSANKTSENNSSLNPRDDVKDPMKSKLVGSLQTSFPNFRVYTTRNQEEQENFKSVKISDTNYYRERQILPKTYNLNGSLYVQPKAIGEVFIKQHLVCPALISRQTSVVFG